MTLYMVCDSDGNALTDGLQEHEATRVAQRMASSRGESVWLSESGSDGLGDEIEPASLSITPRGGTTWACHLGRYYLGSIEFGTINDVGQWTGDMDDLIEVARDRFDLDPSVEAELPF